jgi:hypothetical protein
MNVIKYNNKVLPIALTITATMVVLFVAPTTLATPIFALGHWNEGDEFDNSKEGNTDDSSDNSPSQVNHDGLVSCLANTQKGIIVTEEDVKDCVNTIESGEDAEDNRSNSDNDAITVSDDDPEDGVADLNEFGKERSGTEGSAENDENEDEDVG